MSRAAARTVARPWEMPAERAFETRVAMLPRAAGALGGSRTAGLKAGGSKEHRSMRGPFGAAV